MKPPQAGFTLVETMVAVVLVGVGILAIAGSSSLVTRMIAGGKAQTQAAMAASHRVEMLRLAALSSYPRCTSADFASGGPVSQGRLTESWSVAATGSLRRVRVTVTYLTARGGRSAVLESAIPC